MLFPHVMGYGRFRKMKPLAGRGCPCCRDKRYRDERTRDRRRELRHEQRADRDGPEGPAGLSR
jgi:hypothetical protein